MKAAIPTWVLRVFYERVHNGVEEEIGTIQDDSTCSSNLNDEDDDTVPANPWPFLQATSELFQ